MGYPSYPHSTVLILGESSIYSLLPSTSSAQVESLLENGKLVEAEALLGQTEGDLAQRSSTLGDKETLRYLHQCLAFALMRQTRFREATTHFVKGAIDPRIPVSYFDELRFALFSGPPSRDKDGNATSQGVDEDSAEVEVWDGIREYMPEETSIDDIIATNLVRNYSPYMRPDAIPGSPTKDESAHTEPSTSPRMQSGTRTHPATIVMREGLRVEAGEMVKSILVAVLGSAEMWSKDVIEITSTALALLYAHERDTNSLLALFAPPLSSTSSRPASRPSSRPPSRPGSTSHGHLSNGHQMSIPSLPPQARHASQSILTGPPRPALPLRPAILEPVFTQLTLWGPLLEMWKVHGEWGKVVDVLVGLAGGTHVDASVVNPLEQIFTILTPPRPNDASASTMGMALGLDERERTSLVKKWAAWLAGKDIERGLELLTSLPLTRHRRPTGAAGRGRDKVADREKDTLADEFVILSELRNTNTLAAKRYLEWLVVGQGLGKGGKETTEATELFGELAWNCLEDVLGYVADETIGRLWKAKAASYASSPGTSATISLLPAPPSKSNSLPLSGHPGSLPPSPSRSPFVSYFTSTTPDSPSKRARIKTLLLLQSLKEGTRVVQDMQDKIVGGGWDKILGLEMAVLHSKIPSVRTTLETLYGLGDTSTAETYASSNGSAGVLGTKLGMSAAEGCGLSDWSAWFAKGSSVGSAKGEGGNFDLLKMLLEVYIEVGDKQQTARFLSAQTKRLDAVEMLPLVPDAWPFCTLSTYLTRSLRRTQHRTHEGQIVKAICAGQNLAVLDSTFEILREEGALVEEAVSDDEDREEGDGGSEKGRGKEGAVGKSFDEKVVLRGGEAHPAADVVHVHVGGFET